MKCCANYTLYSLNNLYYSYFIICGLPYIISVALSFWDITKLNRYLNQRDNGFIEEDYNLFTRLFAFNYTFIIWFTLIQMEIMYCKGFSNAKEEDIEVSLDPENISNLTRYFKLSSQISKYLEVVYTTCNFFKLVLILVFILLNLVIQFFYIPFHKLNLGAENSQTYYNIFHLVPFCTTFVWTMFWIIALAMEGPYRILKEKYQLHQQTNIVNEL